MNENFMKEKPVFPLLVSMALPMVISMLVNSLYNIVDSSCRTDQRRCHDGALPGLSGTEFCKCRCHRFWNRTECGDFVLSGSG